MNIGVLVIGSLLWDNDSVRKKWRKELLPEQKVAIKIPIRYGRKSTGKKRRNTYTMIFSNDLKDQSTFGSAFIIPYVNSITTEEDFIKKMKNLAEAEGFGKQICKDWGVVSIIINPFAKEENKASIEKWWSNLRLTTLQNTSEDQRPIINNFGAEKEVKSIDTNWKLNIDTNFIFKSDILRFDAIVATANAIKAPNNNSRYPTSKEIAQAIHRNNYYEYFLKNRESAIHTFQDKYIAKILKRKYKVSLKSKLKELNSA